MIDTMKHHGMLVVVIVSCLLYPQTGKGNNFQDCMLQAIETAEDTMTIGELRLQCEKKVLTGSLSSSQEDNEKIEVVEDRMRQDREHLLQPFTLMAHKPSYLLLAAYNASQYNPDLFRQNLNNPTYELDDIEAQFQLSIKFPLLISLLDDTCDVYAAYTNHSFWQVYNDDISSPFRETNHEPEVWVQFHPKWEFLGFTNTWNSFGIVHQSNGSSGVLSRSWNRVYAWLTAEKGNLAMSIKPWIRIPEDAEDDDNPDITTYMGHYEVSASYKWRKNVFSLMTRNNLESGFSKGAIELSWSFPFFNWRFLKGYVQYFNGYGESLIDYNQHVNKIGIGVALTDWL